MVRKAVLVGLILIGSLTVPAGGSPAPVSGPRTRSADNGPAPDGLTRALQNGHIDRALYALERAESAFRLSDVRDRYGSVRRPDPHAATLLLRDLAQNLDSLDGREKRRAQRILARPTDGASDPQHHGYDAGAGPVQHTCDVQTNVDTGKEMKLCFHWVTTTADAPDLTNANLEDPRPDFIELVSATFTQVWEEEINNLNYRSPIKDGASGPNNGLDIYLADVGQDGVYGYCTNDDPDTSSRSQPAYCVIDNDFAQNDFFPNAYGTPALQATAAHEFFHAVQFAYDWQERLFFMEGTAVWIEDEVFDHVNANYDYLHDSALHQPEVPLDAGDVRPDENFEYGSWLFWRFLGERFSVNTIRSMWEKASKKTVFDTVRNVLSSRNSNLADAYADFAEWNRVLDETNSGLKRYEEGVPYMAYVNYRYPPTDAEFWLGPARTNTGSRRLMLDHLSMRYVLIQPFDNTARGTELKINVDANNVPGARARLVLITADRTPVADVYDWCAETQQIKLDRKGAGARTVPFRPARCKGEKRDYLFLYLTLVNGGFKDNARFDYSARTIQ